MPAMELKIEVEHELEIELSDGVNEDTVPVVAYGKPIIGKVILVPKKGVKSTTFSGLELVLRSTATHVTERMGLPSEDLAIGNSPVAVPLALETSKTYTLDCLLEVSLINLSCMHGTAQLPLAGRHAPSLSEWTDSGLGRPGSLSDVCP